MSPEPTAAQLLAAYDEQLREEADVDGALDVARHGPLWLVRLPGGRGFVTYRSLDGSGTDEIRGLVAAAVAHFAEGAEVREVEWKTRGHDIAPGLEEALVAQGFAAEETESVMIGPLEGLVGDGRVPEGVRVRRATEEGDVRAVGAMTDRAFGKEADGSRADALVALLARDDGTQQWVAEVEGRPVSAGRLIPVEGTEFVGIWGGATLPEFRHRGIYRALTAARARAALEEGYRYLHSDSTRLSRPILERSGLMAVSTTTPWVRRAGTPAK